MTKTYLHHGHEFETLEVFHEVPDTKYKYVCCSFYKKDVNKKFYIRADLRLYRYQVLRCEEVNGFVSIKELQKHPVSERLVHADFYIIDQASSNFRLRLEVKYENQDKAPGIKLGGFLNITSRNLEVKIPGVDNLVPYLRVDLTGYAQEQSVRIKDVIFNNLVPLRPDLTVATLMPSKGGD